jgi:type IV pilus assembly protein PilW
MNTRNFQKGMTLIELMVSMVLGLVVVGGVVSVLVANKSSYRTNEGLSQIQETARSAFELVARDVRQAGGAGCDNAQRMANTLTAGTAWWQNWSSIQGYDGGVTDPAVATSTATGERVAATDTIHMMGIDGGMLPILSHNAPGGVLTINAATTPFRVGDVMLVCDFDHTTTFQATAYDPTNVTVSHTSGSGTPGNCSQGLGFPTDCGSATGNVHVFNQNSQIGRLYAVDWYVGNNGRAGEGGTSLYRRRLDNVLGVPTPVTEEIAAGVTNMQVQYGVNGSNTISDASALVGAAAWAPVNSVFITLTVRSTDNFVSTSSATNQGRLQRTFTYVITLRNRVP